MTCAIHPGRSPHLIFSGCHDWASWCAAARLDIPEPSLVLFAHADASPPGDRSPCGMAGLRRLRFLPAWRLVLQPDRLRLAGGEGRQRATARYSGVA